MSRILCSKAIQTLGRQKDIFTSPHLKNFLSQHPVDNAETHNWPQCWQQVTVSHPSLNRIVLFPLLRLMEHWRRQGRKNGRAGWRGDTQQMGPSGCDTALVLMHSLQLGTPSTFHHVSKMCSPVLISFLEYDSPEYYCFDSGLLSLMFWRLESRTSGCLYIKYILGDIFLMGKYLFSCFNLTWLKEKHILLNQFLQGN